MPKAQAEAAARARSAAESRAARTENMEAAKPAKLKKAKGKVPRQKLSPPEIDRLVAAAVASLEDDKAEDIQVLDVATRASFADRMIIATGLVERQINAMAAKVEKALYELGSKRIRTEASPDWVLLDAGDLLIHLFRPEARANYRLEKMWGPDSPTDGPLDEDAPIAAPVASDFDDEPEQSDDEDLSGEFEDDVIDLSDDGIHIEDENIAPGDEDAN
ncbi:ribosome silencing factor [Roseomonas sp. 573]|uniref:Ribosomal silencing factor RsfS n=2 Tax=Roseomonas haemaphysalidis TaxID=2768162 RepID=A0ABS3KNT3_9PROT|nr:ribosome silencing factor [Roseomonas haemaphysalidis]